MDPAELESRELMSLCLKKIRGLNKVKLTDANWIWTEPHSRRLKIKLSVQKEVFNNAIVEQTFVVEFIVANQQCPDCQKSYTEHTWESVIQVRQKVQHKRTFLWLEQLLIKHNVCDKVINIRDQPDGLDFYFPSKSLGQHMINFLESVIPVRCKFSKKLITQDDRSNTYRYKYTWCAEIPPVCKDDVVVLNKRMCASMGGVTPLLLCYKVSNTIVLIDPNTMQRVQISSKAYWRDPPAVACNRQQLKNFIVCDIETPSDPDEKVEAGRFLQGEATVMREDQNNQEQCDNQFMCVTHLAHQLKPGDTCAGYDLKNVNLGADVLSRLRGRDLPEVVIVRKTYPHRKNRSKSRKFQLKTLKKDANESNRRSRRKDQDQQEDDMEMFMNDIEEDPDFRSDINLYRRKIVSKNRERKSIDVEGDDEDEDEDDGFPEIGLNELIDDMEDNLKIGKGGIEQKSMGVSSSATNQRPSDYKFSSS
eukprot:CAMPEP_0184503152 /NCGR_PEP_ID=MMETSP0113_2-20130426/51724_1 /TAXON_ID=91329 /ORGANISM="Norrisiella sphaerica, Strain BC52" /LENGTH=475 /DNA_ID=CAMNT_0026892599 /DNA_START=248 /DNA_END=1676 /DNA_ORIENTATION=-